MAKTIMPSCHRWFDGGQDTLIDTLLGQNSSRQWVETIFISSVKKRLPRVPILKKKIPRLNLKEGIIIICEFMNGKKILGCTRHMKNIFENEITFWSVNCRLTDMTNRHT
jgi:hypothetical protein